MRTALADSIGTLAAPVASSQTKAKSFLAEAFPDVLNVETKNADRPSIAGSDYGMYANVVVNGKVVASLSNSGCAAIADGYGGQAMAAALDMPGTGPKLAQRRAEMIAQALGGTVEKLSTAQTPEQWAKGGKRMGMIDLWGLDGSEPPGYRPQMAQDAMDVLLKEQETADKAG